mmetsp:Transcript_2675/g.3992  ORF Transcript_2675/g.3992 Transcript_2675/m.3992 type:complete len:126 (-) Transcript_2675:759-1136(-)|eukprot:CAMPEP_0178927468 /NCGR_PEP_ID=MMETSP0786-20121207/19208_1 /TAXON_ID=186022 /ORGANISM="Thalassionema frauenfeldii, Strain CCMP 1798" /LENGTH=125 /DNA_ID=CAMNT_0020602911 /DNA_START=2749 /DNA_END=3126 /DNA_ORIENTATION=+
MKIIAAATNDQEEQEEEESRSDLDSHANMAVVGRDSTVLTDMGQKVDVNPFTPHDQSLKEVKIVDEAVQHCCPYTMKEYCLVLRNCLHVPSMNYNLTPPLIMREAGIIVNDVPNINCKDPSLNEV